MDVEVRTGDWVRPHSRGIWRVSRILTDFNEFRYRLSDPKVRSHRVLIFSNRFVNDTWKRSFASECSEAALTPISDSEQQKIGELLRDEKLRNAFAKFESNPKRIDLIVNLGFGPMDPAARGRFADAMSAALESPMRDGMILDEVLESIRAAGFDDSLGGVPQMAGLQLVSPTTSFVVRNL